MARRDSPAETAGSAEVGAATPRVVLYRCPTPTNFLCPCGAVARRLRKLDVEHRTERVPYRRSDRPEILELTKQNRVPVLIDGDEVVHDSKRIIQYLEHTRGPAQPGADKPGDPGSTIEADGNA